MATEIQYALMAGHAYRTTRDEINWMPAPRGWPFCLERAPLPSIRRHFANRRRSLLTPMPMANGVSLIFSDAPRNRLADDQGNLIDGGTGNDLIAAGTGADFIHGGADKDLIYGMDQGDVLFGDGENDVIYGDGNIPVGNSLVWALPENHGNDVIDGGAGDDYLIGQGKDDIIFGGGGDDVIYGDDNEADLPVAYHGNDFLFGGSGKDQLVGGAGDDYLEGGAGDDTIWGGAGKDIYVFNAGDPFGNAANDSTYIFERKAA